MHDLILSPTLATELQTSSGFGSKLLIRKSVFQHNRTRMHTFNEVLTSENVQGKYNGAKSMYVTTEINIIDRQKLNCYFIFLISPSERSTSFIIELRVAHHLFNIYLYGQTQQRSLILRTQITGSFSWFLWNHYTLCSTVQDETKMSTTVEWVTATGMNHRHVKYYW